ncbi:TetR/AcrR family transcriptional regulator [Miltoncostaea marina]|uniref:TetR/AcrR family transcriptional regulator n=1 Tax=Miltoncostaea marina TaxID=2843215 RepID=UPI001C3D4894|nr:TetR/AcrR family transcriptional regulator [Miltoncostaea marina]
MAEGPSPRARQIVAAGRALLEEEGPAGLSMRRVAERVGVRAASLYKHLPDKAALEAAIISQGFAELADAFAAAAGGGEPLAAIGAAYRRFAAGHPHLYRLMTERPLPRELLDPGVEARAAAPLVAAAGGDADLARAAWAFAHGMTILELTGRFPPGADLDAAWRAGVAALSAAGPAPPAGAPGGPSA